MVGVFEVRDLQAEGWCIHCAHLLDIWLICSSQSGPGRRSLPSEGEFRVLEQQVASVKSSPRLHKVFARFSGLKVIPTENMWQEIDLE
jgi:hypothetical protein